MSDLAASGGYYIAMPADAIVAQPATLTGSIGIYGGKLVTGGVYEKLGAHIEATTIGKNAGMDSPVAPFSPSELAKLESYLRAFYTDFVKKAAASRHTTPEAIDAVAQGRVWTGRQAKEKGLVDELGGLDRAVALAKSRAKIADDAEVELVAFPHPRGLVEMVSDTLGRRQDAAVEQWMSTSLSADELAALRTLRGTTALFRRGEPLALMPFSYVR
jgi:protease-4